jgi:hypothetical protein
MGAGLYSGDPMGDPAGLPCDPEQWSEDSKRSVAYESRPAQPYRDKAYLCWRCKTRDVFTAAEQKYTFEVHKANVSQQRVLCRECHREWVGLDREADECRHRWAAERLKLRNDPEFLGRWLAVLEALPGYNAARDKANIKMLRRLIAKVQRAAERGG